MRTGGQIVVDALIAQGVDTLFQVPGESFLPVLDALHDRPAIRTITCRHESGAANMAEAWGKLSGRPGVVFVTRGPGACHASVGLHTAKQDSTPLVLFVGQVDRPLLGREAFQEVDLEAMFGWTTKWAVTAKSAAELPAIVERAFALAMTGRPGPVAVALPEDILSEPAEVHDPARIDPRPNVPSPEAMAKVADTIRGAAKPLVIAGGTGWRQEDCDALADWAQRWQIPVCVSFRRQDRFDNTHPCYIGDLAFATDPALSAAIADADLILALGTRLGDLATGGYTLLKPPKPAQTLIHVFPDDTELGRVYEPALSVQCHAGPFAAALARLDAPDSLPWSAWRREQQTAYRASLTAGPAVGGVNMNGVVAAFRDALTADTIIASDAGNFAQWFQRFVPFRRLGTQIAPTGGAMGYGVPAGIAAALWAPNRRAIALAGDGGFMMTASELATARQYDANVTFIVVNNGMYGTIRGHQERTFPGRPSGTDLTNPDFVRYAEAFGIPAYKVEATQHFAPALRDANATQGPALIEIVLDPETVSSRATLTQVRDRALGAKR